jgi:hypothetical protein
MEEMQMSEVMSLAEIYAQFESEWVLLENPETTESLEVKSGKVLWHSKSRDEVYRKARELKPRHSAILFTGTLPEDTAVVLQIFFESALKRCHCERRAGFVGKREAIPFGFCLNLTDCFVASLLAMTFWSELFFLSRQ